MGDYNLTGLNPRDFEHLVQSLAIRVIASGVTPFGDGPDGGREASFTGKMEYPSTTAPWDGYLVIQAKFRARPAHDTAKDGEWALEQLKTELEKFENPKRNLPKPEFYLFVTNVVLTPMQDVGSKDKAFELLRRHQASIGLKGYDIWDFDKLCRLLDAHDAIRHRYAAFVTAGDILAEMMQILKDQQPDFWQIITRFLQNEFLAEQFVKLEQAGHTTEQKTALAQVFVDLPVFDRPFAESSVSEQELEQRSCGIVNELLKAGSRVLKRSALMLEVPVSDLNPNPRPEPGRFVIVGGPGQGKSTVGQFICQLHRVAILKDLHSSKIAPEVLSALNSFIKQCCVDKVDPPVIRRFPVRVVLDQFASELANNKIKSLRSYILSRINYRTDEECSAEDLRRWLNEYPWLIVLDGLDEVPATSNRRQVLEKIVEFWTEVSTSDADVLVIATTRPQGYSDDFSPRLYHHRYLLPLPQKRALDYASRLVEARYGNDPDRRARVLKRLKTASEQETTQRLMRSPLQVTIMATLVDRIGQPPQERWRLFQQYYEVIYQRETERDIPASKILQQRKADVNAIHHRVGLFLQTKSEKAGATESRLTVENFQQLVHARIAEEGHEDEQLELRTREITEAALHRLVFLVGLEENRIGFEIRSLQEFMAAEALMDGRDDQVRLRLEAIAPIAHWRNVFLFAAGKCFAERQFLRDMIITICEQLNDIQNDVLAGVTLAGSLLALDLLEDGIAREQPKYARSLARLALQLTTIPDNEANTRLATIYEASLELIFREQVNQRLGQTEFSETLGAWILLCALADRGVGWAQELIDMNWPEDLTQQTEIINTGYIAGHWAIRKLIPLIPKVPPFSVLTLPLNESEKVHKNYDIPDWYLAASKIDPRMFHRMDIGGTETNLYFSTLGRIKLRIRSISDSSLKDLIPLKELPASAESMWAPYISAARFVEQPTPKTLARELRWLGSSPLLKGFGRAVTTALCPWPLAACLFSTDSLDEYAILANKADKGQLGSVEDWIVAEKHWKNEGLTENDLRQGDDSWPFSKTDGGIGFPFVCSNVIFPANRKKTRLPLWYAIWNQYDTLVKGKTKSWMAELALQYLASFYRPYSSACHGIPITAGQLKQILTDCVDLSWHYGILDGIEFPEVLDTDWIELFNWIGNQPFVDMFTRTQSFRQASQLAQAYMAAPSQEGLINVMASLVTDGIRFQFPKEVFIGRQFDTDQLRISAALIWLSQGQWDQSELIALARVLVNSGRDFLPIQALHVAIQYLHGADAERFALALRTEMISAHHSNLGYVIRRLNERMRTRTSQLARKKKWIELDLPPLA